MLGGMFGTPPQARQISRLELPELDVQGRRQVEFRRGRPPPVRRQAAAVASQIKKMRRAMKAHGDALDPEPTSRRSAGARARRSTPAPAGAAPLFNVAPKKQKEYLEDSFKTLTSHRSSWKIGGVYWFTWKDPTNPPDGLCAFCYSAGLFEAGGTTAKPSFGAFKSFTKKTRASASAQLPRPRSCRSFHSGVFPPPTDAGAALARAPAGHRRQMTTVSLSSPRCRARRARERPRRFGRR